MALCQPTPAELGEEVTIVIAAVTKPDGQIVIVSDRMISYGDITQAEDDAALKASALPDRWGCHFAANDLRLFFPIWRAIADRIPPLKANSAGVTPKGYELEAIKTAAAEGYQYIFEKEFTSRFLTRLGIKSVDDFRKNGLSELGKDVFNDLYQELSKFDLGISLLVHGHDLIDEPRLFEVENPGRAIDHDLLGYAVIGSGYWMAAAALRRRSLNPRQLDATIYRLLEAKFCAETATAVGKSTAVMLFNKKGINTAMTGEQVEVIRKAWEESLKEPYPQAAMDMIQNCGAVEKLLEG
jgi:hypothetical protein